MIIKNNPQKISLENLRSIFLLRIHFQHIYYQIIDCEIKSSRKLFITVFTVYH